MVSPVDPRAVDIPLETQQLHAIHDHTISFEEYAYYASITRAEEKAENERFVAAAGPKTVKSVLKNRFTNFKPPTIVDTPTEPDSPSEKHVGMEEKDGNGNDMALVNRETNPMAVSDAEYKNASRAIRTAGWSSVFYLVTTDILGPFSTP
jgi:hypothetical protein